MDDRQLDELLRRTLSEHARDAQPRSDLAPYVIQRGRTVRRRRQIGAGVAAALVVGAAAVTVPNLIAGPDTTPMPGSSSTMWTSGPSVTSSPTPTTSSSTGGTPSTAPSTGPSPASGSPSATPDSTPSGSATSGPVAPVVGPRISSVPRWSTVGNRVVVTTPTARVTLDPSVTRVRSIQPVSGGYVVLAAGKPSGPGYWLDGAKLIKVGDDGSQRELFGGGMISFAVSPDGTQIVHDSHTYDAAPAQIVVRSVADGSEVKAVDLSPAAPTKPVAWTDRGVVLEGVKAQVELTVWDPSAGGAATPLTGVTNLWDVTAPGTTPSRSLIDVTTGTKHCLQFSSGLAVKADGCIASGTNLNVDVSPDRQFAIVVTADTTGAEVYSLLDVASGALSPLGVPSQLGATPTLRAFAWESGAIKLVPVTANGTTQWWRWKLADGTVEQAPLPPGAHSAFPW